MYGDATAIRHLAARMRDRADEIRAAAARLAGHIDRVPWHGCAADAMRRHADLRLAALSQTARLHDDAAEALDRHAREVQRLQDLIAGIERKIRDLVDAACHRLAEVGRGLVDGVIDGLSGAEPDPADELLAAFRPPPPGHLDWLRVDLPGL
jgi:uncharacterized protein YukE